MPKSDSVLVTTRTIVIIIISIIVLVGIFLLTRSRERTEPPPPPPETPAVNLSDPTLEIRRLSGMILAITPQGFQMDVPSILGVALDANSPLRTREIIITTATRITQSSAKNSAQYAREREAYYKKRAQGERVFPPSSSSEIVIPKSRLKVGDAIQVTGVQDESIKDMNPITAGSIEQQ